MKPALLAGLILAALAGCAAPPEAGPIRLSYAEAEARGPALAGYRRLAQAVAGAYVRVVVYGATEDEGMARVAAVNGASGTIVDPRGYVVTAAHVAQHTRFHARVTTMDGRIRDGTILRVDPLRELALLKIEPFAGMGFARIGDCRLRAGQPVLAIGSPDNRRGVVLLGRIAKPRRAARIDYGDFGFDDAVELEMAVEPGHSGGPLFDAEGRLVGIIAGFGLGDTRSVPYVSTRVGYAVPAAAIASYLAQLIGPRRADSHDHRSRPCDGI